MPARDEAMREVGARPAPHAEEAAALARSALRDAGRRTAPAAARAFQRRSAAEVEPYPEQGPLPKWVLALRERKVSGEDFARAVHDRTMRAPSAQNQRLALLLANEIARRPDGPKLVERYLTPELRRRLSGKGRESGGGHER
jgi:hypothetical protein